MSDLVINVRQIGNYPARTASDGGELVLVQPNGVGSGYQTLRAATLVSTALGDASLGVGYAVPGDAAAGNVISQHQTLPNTGELFWNAYFGRDGHFHYWQSGLAAGTAFLPQFGFWWGLAPAGQAGAVAGFKPLMELSLSGMVTLPDGTLMVARDPANAMEVATMGWVGRNTVASFMGRRGQVQLFSDDVTRALGIAIDDSVATTASVSFAIQELLRSHPFVWSFNGRCGNVWLGLDDVMAVFMAPGAQPTAPLAPVGDSSLRLANTAWVSRLLYGKYWTDLAGVYAPLASPALVGIPTAPTAPFTSDDGTIATTAWVRGMISEFAAGVVNFNGRTGFVTLELADIEAIFQSPGVHPLVNNAPVGAINGEITNAHWVNNAIQASRDTSVLSFNTRVGDVVLGLQDIRDAEGQRRLFIGVDPPTNPLETDMWVDATDPTGGTLYVRYVDGTPGQWIAISGGAPGPMGGTGNPGPPGPALRPKGTVPSVAALLALPGPHLAGDLWFVSATNESFAWDDTGTGQWVSLGQIGAPFPDAPTDGGMYARQNGNWVRIANDGVY